MIVNLVKEILRQIFVAALMLWRFLPFVRPKPREHHVSPGSKALDNESEENATQQEETDLGTEVTEHQSSRNSGPEFKTSQRTPPTKESAKGDGRGPAQPKSSNDIGAVASTQRAKIRPPSSFYRRKNEMEALDKVSFSSLLS